MCATKSICLNLLLQVNGSIDGDMTAGEVSPNDLPRTAMNTYKSSMLLPQDTHAAIPGTYDKPLIMLIVYLMWSWYM